MPDTDQMFPEENECDSTTTILIGSNTEADVTCGKDKHDDDSPHVARQVTETKDGDYASILYIWK